MRVILCLVAIFDFTISEIILDHDIFELEIILPASIENLENWEREIDVLPFQNVDRILVCLNDEATDLRPDILTKFPNLNIEYHDPVSCQNEIKNDDENPQTKTILSVIAPEPFWNNSEEFSSEIPMYFYDTLYEDRIDSFPNGLVPHQRQWHLLKHAFLYYINAHEWTRIAIVSDNSPNSQEFEPELVEEFKRNNLVFNIQRCVRERCDFRRALLFFKYHGAVIIVANVEGRHARNLMKAAKELDMTSYQYLWLVRGPFKDSQKFQNVISINLSPTPAANYPEDFDKTPHWNSICRGLELISTAVDSVNEKERIDKYYRSIFKKMNASYSHDKATAFIRSGNSHFIQMLVIEGSSIKCSYQKGSDAPMYDLGEYCLLRTDSFTSPCSDTWAVLICMVWLIFILMVFLLVYFFNRCLTYVLLIAPVMI